MEKTVQTAGQQPVISAIGVDINRLEQWYKEYMAVDGDVLELESSIILAVNSDPIDISYVESKIHQAASITHVSRGYCNNCQHLFSHWPDLGTKSSTHAVGRHFRTEEIEAATRNGCKSCAFLLVQLKDARLLNTFRRIEKRLSLLYASATASISISNWGLSDRIQLLWLNLPGKVAKHSNSPGGCAIKFESHVMSPSANRYEDKIDSFDLANKWLRTCLECHKSCRSKSKLKRPTRLISIVNDVVKLVLTADWETLPQYATLSYCWGRGEFMKLTPDKLDSFLNNIPYSDLPKTFVDAIYIARKLGLEYIWIDALCIIQAKDDDSDWLKESGRMRSVYGSAHLNIAASSATNVYEGCFSKPANYSGGFIAQLTTNRYCTVQNFHSFGVYDESTHETHLASRGWTFQEKLLAPRTIYFGDRGMFWECRSTTGSEFLPDGYPYNVGPQLVCPEGKAWNWSDIVENYSRAHLTHGTDKLPALSGVARRQHEATGDEYLAGMWRKGLMKQLGWSRSRLKNKRPDWRAPTWSWTSIDGPTSYWPYWNHDPFAKNEYVKVLDATTTLAGSDPFGAVSGGELQLRCTAMVHGHYCESDNLEDAESGQKWNDRVMLDAKSLGFPVKMDCLEDDYIKAGNSIYLLPLFGGESGFNFNITENKDDAEESSFDGDDEKWVPELMVCGIVVQRSGLTKGRFRRIGSFDFRHTPYLLDDPESDTSNYHRFLRAMEEAGTSMAENECAEIILDTEPLKLRYAITIV